MTYSMSPLVCHDSCWSGLNIIYHHLHSLSVCTYTILGQVSSLNNPLLINLLSTHQILTFPHPLAKLFQNTTRPLKVLHIQINLTTHPRPPRILEIINSNKSLELVHQ